MIDGDKSFQGFSLPEKAWLPPEFIELLPDIRKAAELKVTITAIYETLRVGSREGAVISLTEFEALTGLDAKGVLRGIRDAVVRGTIQREEKGNSYFYRLTIRDTGKMPVAKYHWQNSSGETPPATGKTPPQTGILPVNVHACTSIEQDVDMHNKHDAAEARRKELVSAMRKLGVALKVAENIAGRYDPSYLIEKLNQARFAIEQGIAENGAGWFVASVKDDWGPPIGYDPKAQLSEEDRRKRYISGKYADIIQH